MDYAASYFQCEANIDRLNDFWGFISQFNQNGFNFPSYENKY